MINKTERLLYVPFTYSKDDVSAVTFNMQVLILKLLMPWGIPRSTRDHKTHIFLLLDSQVHRENPSDVAPFSRAENLHARSPRGQTNCTLCSPTGSGCKRQLTTGQEYTPALVPELQGKGYHLFCPFL